MIQNYTKPQLTIRQVLQTAEGAPAERMNALVIGPQYTVSDLNTIPSKQDLDITGDSLNLEFTDETGKTWNPETDSVVLESSSVALRAENVEGLLVDNAENALSGNSTRANSAEIVFSNNVRDTVGSDIDATLRGRNIQIGDVVRATISGGAKQVRRVAGFIRAVETTAEISAVTAGNNNVVASAEASTVIASPAGYSAIEVSSSGNAGLQALGSKYLLNGSFYLGEIIEFTITSYDDVLETGVLSYTTSRGSFAGSVGFTKAAAVYTAILTVNAGEDSESTITLEFEAAGDPAPGDKLIVRYTAAYTPTPGLVEFAGTYSGTLPNTFYVRVLEADPFNTSNLVQIFDARNRFVIYEATVVTNDYTSVLVDGVEITINPNLNFVTGDVFFANATPDVLSTTKSNGVILNSPMVVPNSAAASFTLDVDFRKLFSGYITDADLVSGSVVTVDGNEVSYAADLTLYEAGRVFSHRFLPLVDGVGKVFATFRALVLPQNLESAFIVDQFDDVESLFGPSKLANDLSFAVAKAKSGAQDKRVYVLRTDGNDAASFAETLKKVERNDLVYAIAAITDNLEAIKAVASHCDAMSVPQIKNFRRCYFGTDVPSQFAVLETTPDGDFYTAEVTPVGDYFRLVNFISGDPILTALDILPGDFVEMFGAQYPIAQVISDTEILLSSGPSSSITGAAKIVKANTADNSVLFVSNISKAIASRRAANVWCDRGLGYDRTGTQLVTIPSKFIAAEVAGLRSALVPWLGLTRTEIKSVVSAPVMYNKYTDSQLNKAAANGTFVITQELSGGNVFIRHQLTTEVTKGILYYEDSVGANIDNLSFSFKDSLDTLIGGTNINRETLAIIENKAFEILKVATQSPVLSLVGPQLISFFNEDGEEEAVTVRVHPTFKDRVILKVKIEPPVPLNGIDAELEAEIGLTL